MQTVIEAFLRGVTIKGVRLWGVLCFCLSACARLVIGWFSCCRGRVLHNFQSLRPLPFSSLFASFTSILFLPLSSPPILISLLSTHPHLSPPLLPVNTVIAWGALQCITDLSPLVLFMALSLFKFNQASMEPLEPFQFTTWTPQDGKSYANIKV